MKKKHSLTLIPFLIILIVVGGAILRSAKLTEKTESKAVAARVIDGDTFETNKGKMIRLTGIDASETKECFAEEAKRALIEMILEEDVYLESDINEMDRFGRELRYVFKKRGKEKIFINEWLLEKGMARYFFDTVNLKYQERLMAAAEKARQEKVGLWKKCADPKLGGCIVKGNLGTMDKRWYHLPGFRHYKQTVVNLDKGDKWFCSEKEAIKAGFVKARE